MFAANRLSLLRTRQCARTDIYDALTLTLTRSCSSATLLFSLNLKFCSYVHIAVPLKEKDDSLQTFIEHVQYTNNM